LSFITPSLRRPLGPQQLPIRGLEASPPAAARRRRRQPAPLPLKRNKMVAYHAGPVMLYGNQKVAYVGKQHREADRTHAPPSRVWRALTDHREFGEWFGVKLEGPFVPGQVARGTITYPGYEHLKWEVTVQKMATERLFSFTWHPYAVDPDIDYRREPPTLVEFRLEAKDGGTILLVTESGFDAIPRDRRFEAFRMNERGWTEQMKSIERHVGEPR
jgi:uncharacterized protein YndB with AHSA1/START domain